MPAFTALRGGGAGGYINKYYISIRSKVEGENSWVIPEVLTRVEIICVID
jgi:hypothetical protein